MLLQIFTLLLLSATALTSQQEVKTETPAPSAQTQSPTTVGIKEEQFPAVTEEAALIVTPPSLVETEDGLRRRLVTFDQRQEGQYNIRADLENFMIVVIPPGPQEGLNLLDLLTKSSLRGNTKSSPNKRKHATALKSFYQRQQLQQQQRQQQLQQLQQQQQQQLPISDFIEGRTPYHVDISAVSEEQLQQQQPRLHRQQVDVLPPQLVPLPQLIKPFHLEAEPELIQALPPAAAAGTIGSSSSISSSNNLLEGYNQMGSHYYRNSRSLSGDNFLNNNRLSPEGNFGSSSNARSISVPIYRSDVAHDSANNLYPPIDVPAYIINEAQPRLWQLDDEPTPIQPKHLIDGDVLSFELLGDSLGDSKTLLRDGLARCAPGQRRDSYGACRQVEGY